MFAIKPIQYALISSISVLFLCSSGFASNFSFNVSERASGVYNSINWNHYFLLPSIPCGTSCEFASASTAGIDLPTTNPSLEPHVWPPKPANNQSFQPLVFEVDPTVDSPPTYYYSDYYQLAEVDRPYTGTYVNAHTFSSGRSESATSAYIEIDGSEQENRAQFLQFKIPSSILYKQLAYKITPGSNGGTYNYYPPKQSQARYSFDVVVNGLIVWTQEELFNTWKDYEDTYNGEVSNTFGSDKAAGNTVLLFLGYIPENEIWDISLVLRTDVAADAPKCGSDPVNHNLEYGASMIHCYSLTQNSAVGALNRSNLDFFQVFSKDL